MRKLTLALAGIAIVGLVGDAAGRDAQRPPVRISPELAQEWLLQLSPGSGVVQGYRRPHLGSPVVTNGSGVVLGGQRRIAVPAGPAGVGIGRLPRMIEPLERHPRQAAAGEARLVTRSEGFDPAFLPQTVEYRTKEKPGTIVVDTRAKFLYLVGEDGTARRYGVGVGKPGFAWAGIHKVTRKAEWPGWTPPAQMIARERKKGRILPAHMEGGPGNPLGARALYLGSTLYRIHGTNQPWTIGKSVSSGCIRMRNEDVVDLYGRVRVGTKVVVL